MGLKAVMIIRILSEINPLSLIVTNIVFFISGISLILCDRWIPMEFHTISWLKLRSTTLLKGRD